MSEQASSRQVKYSVSLIMSQLGGPLIEVPSGALYCTWCNARSVDRDHEEHALGCVYVQAKKIMDDAGIPYDEYRR